MKVLPTGQFDYDLYPLTEEIIEIDEEGNDLSFMDDVVGIIDVPEEDLYKLRVTKKFNAELNGIVDMTEEEIAQHGGKKRKDNATAEIKRLSDVLASMDWMTNLYVENKLGEREWRFIVKDRDTLRRRINDLIIQGGVSLPEINQLNDADLASIKFRRDLIVRRWPR